MTQYSCRMNESASVGYNWGTVILLHHITVLHDNVLEVLLDVEVIQSNQPGQYMGMDQYLYIPFLVG